MKQLTGLDASFLYMETGSSFGHVSSLSVFERPDDPDFRPFEVYRDRLASKLGELEPFTRRLVQVPFELDHPYWIADPDFDLDFHARHMALPAPGDDEQLATQVARLVGRPMDRSRPLWELYVIEGLSDDDFAVLLKIHHATIDGASGAQLLNMLLDVSPFAVTPQVTVETVKGERVPSQAEMFNRSIVNLARRPEKAIRLQLLALRRFGEITRSKGIATMARTARRSMTAGRSSGSNGADESDRAPRLPSQAAPATPFNRSITPHRRFAFRSVPLSDIKALKSHLDATVNDVVMGICAGALRRYLELKGALPTDPLVTMIPVSIRTGDEPDQWTNRVSGLVSPLPTHLSDPLERVATVHDAMDAAKQQFDLLPADVMVELSGFAPPALATRAIRMAASMRIADRMNPPVNLVISNVPGSRVPLYLGAARLKHYYPVSTVGDGMGLNITVTSYLDTLDFGLVACRELVPDLWDLADLCVAELDVLFEAAGIERPSMSAAARTAGGAEPAEAADESKTKAKARA